MTRLSLGAIAVCVALAACGGDDAGLSVEDLSGRTFASTAATEDGKPVPLVPGTRLLLHFGQDGRLSATAGCNETSASVESLDGGRLRLDDGANSTTAQCPEIEEQEDWLGKLVSDDPLVEVEPGRLVLTAGARRAEFVEPRADTQALLTGATWVVSAVVAKGVPAPVSISSPLSFREDGTFVQGRPDCPEATGEVEFERGSIRVGSWGEGTCAAPSGAPLVMSDTGRMTVEQAGEVVRLRAANGTGFDLRPAG